MIPILDAGHGGMIGGEYQTSGKRSPDWKPHILYEGRLNRIITRGICTNLDRCNLPYYHVSPEDYDVSLNLRKKRANEIYKKNRNTYLLSIHFNATRKMNQASGYEFWTWPGESKSDEIANDLNDEFADYPLRMRTDFSDGDMDKEAKFTVLGGKYPAVLFEGGFMNHYKDYRWIMSQEGQEDIIERLTEGIIKLYNK